MAKVTSLWHEIVKFPAMLAFASKRFVRCPSYKNIQTLCATRKAYSSHEAVSYEGPLGQYNTYLQKQVLKPDECQKQIVHKLQNLYERLKDYDPQQRTGKYHWLVFRWSKTLGKKSEVILPYFIHFLTQRPFQVGYKFPWSLNLFLFYPLFAISKTTLSLKCFKLRFPWSQKLLCYSLDPQEGLSLFPIFVFLFYSSHSTRNYNYW